MEDPPVDWSACPAWKKHGTHLETRSCFPPHDDTLFGTVKNVGRCKERPRTVVWPGHVTVECSCAVAHIWSGTDSHSHILSGFESYCPTGELTRTTLVYPRIDVWQAYIHITSFVCAEPVLSTVISLSKETCLLTDIVQPDARLSSSWRTALPGTQLIHAKRFQLLQGHGLSHPRSRVPMVYQAMQVMSLYYRTSSSKLNSQVDLAAQLMFLHRWMPDWLGIQCLILVKVPRPPGLTYKLLGRCHAGLGRCSASITARYPWPGHGREKRRTREKKGKKRENKGFGRENTFGEPYV